MKEIFYLLLACLSLKCIKKDPQFIPFQKQILFVLTTTLQLMVLMNILWLN